MKKFLFGFLFGLLAGGGGAWYLTQPGSAPDLSTAQEQVARGAEQLKQSVQKTIDELSAEDIQEELARTGTVIREKAKQAGQAIADATADARISATIKTRLARAPGISSLRISVSTTDGLVTLSGTVKSHEELAQAVKIALETQGVHKVISTIQVEN